MNLNSNNSNKNTKYKSMKIEVFQGKRNYPVTTFNSQINENKIYENKKENVGKINENIDVLSKLKCNANRGHTNSFTENTSDDNTDNFASEGIN